MMRLQVGPSAYDVEAILFDKDGTLLDLDRLWGGWCDQLLHNLKAVLAPGLILDVGTLRQNMGVSQEGVLDRRGPLAIGSMDDVMAVLAATLYQHHGIAWNDAVRLVSQARTLAEARMEWGDAIVPLPGLTTFLASAQNANLPLGIVTSDSQQNARHHLHCLHLGNNFASVIGHDDVKIGKPFPEMVLRACAELGVSPNRTVLFGDSNGDMQMAEEAGLLAGIGLSSQGDGSHLSAAHQVIRDYTQCTFFDR